MATHAPFWIKPFLFVQIHTGSGTPYAARINSKKLVGFALLLCLVFSCSVIGSLLFFRELEVNRKLQERLLALETKEGIAQYMRIAERSVAASPGKTQANKPTLNVAAPVKETKPKPIPKKPSMVTARIADLNSQCLQTKCSVKLSMVPTSSGLAQGQLLLVLETEIPRIGAAGPTSSIRKRFFAYPGYESHDQLDQKKLHRLKRKSYRFSRALNTNAEFEIGKLLRPLAINVYLFNKAGNSIHHERKVIERGD